MGMNTVLVRSVCFQHVLYDTVAQTKQSKERRPACWAKSIRLACQWVNYRSQPGLALIKGRLMTRGVRLSNQGPIWVFV